MLIINISNKPAHKLRFFALLLCVFSTTGCYFWGGYSTFSHKIDRTPYLKLAQEETEAGNYAKAIEHYEAHILNRLQALSRLAPDPSTGENPYFYKAIIGDLYLKLDKPDDAKQSYLEAKEHDVSNDLISDRIRQLARWYRDRGNFDMAQSLLNEYRHLDPLMFDNDIDQLHREMIRQLDTQHPA